MKRVKIVNNGRNASFTYIADLYIVHMTQDLSWSIVCTAIPEFEANSIVNKFVELVW